MKITVVYSIWGAGEDEFVGGTHDVKLTKKTAPLFAGGEAAGSIIVEECSDDERALLDGHVESQEDSEAKLAEAQADGRWHEGNLRQFLTERLDRLAYHDTLDEADPGRLSDEEHGLLVHQTTQARAVLDALENKE